jgi:hypothetical protein
MADGTWAGLGGIGTGDDPQQELPEGEELRGVTWVRIVEVEQGNWAIGGQSLNAAAVHAMGGKLKAA